MLKKELEEFENTYPQRFRAFYLVDNPPEGWTQGKGHITKDLLKTVLPEPKEGEKVKVFVCGPPGMYKAISGTKKSPADQGELDGALKASCHPSQAPWHSANLFTRSWVTTKTRSSSSRRLEED